MEKVITKLSEYLHSMISEPDAYGTLKLTGEYTLEYSFYSGGKLRLKRKSDEISKMTFSLLKNNDWITPCDMKKNISKLFKDVSFTKSELAEIKKIWA